MSLDLSFDASAFSGTVPLFPLPGCVLLPGGLLPLHVFEQRYREMVTDALAGERLIAIALLRPGYEDEYEEAPEIEPFVCLGRIVLQQQLEGGRYNMILAGLRRARIVEEDRSRSYRRAQVELLPDHGLEAIDVAKTARALHDRIESLPAALIRYGERLAAAMSLLAADVPATLDLGQAIDLIAEALELSVADRLELLQLPSVPARLTAFEATLARRQQELLGPRVVRSWPPSFSLN